MTPKNQARSEDADDGHQEDKQLWGGKRQAATDPDGQRHRKAMKIPGASAVDFVHDATNDMSANMLPKDDDRGGTDTTAGDGYFLKFDPSTAEGQMLVQTIADDLAKLSDTSEVVAYMTPRLHDPTRAMCQPNVVALTQGEINLAIEKGNAELGHRRP